MTSESPSPSNRLKLGPLVMLLAAGDVRYVRVAGVELLRRIYVAVRDQNWGTIPATITDYRLQPRPDGFHATYHCQHEAGDIDFAWTAAIDGKARASDGELDAEISFAMTGEARSTFMTNRTGFCILHPIAECAGKLCTIEHPGGTTQQHRFPDLIRPHQPFTNIRAISHSPAPGLTVEVRFDGDQFETEDQRNWSDGSYKTYCRPLAMGFPYELQRGQRVRQTVTVRVRGQLPPIAERRNTITIGQSLRPLPAIGLCSSCGRNPPSESEIRLLHALNLSHLRVDLCPGETHSLPLNLHGVPLEIALHLPSSPASPIEMSAQIARVIVYRDRQPFATAADVELARQMLCSHQPQPLIGAGTVGNFTELNRNRPPSGSMPLLAFPINPQVHATDDLSLIENLQGQADTVRTARSFAPDAHLAIGPIILHRQPDPFAAGKSGIHEQPLDGDRRLRSAFGAAWTVVSINRLSAAGADSLTYYQTTGPFGLLDHHRISPLYDLFKSIGQMKHGNLLQCASSDPLAFDALAIQAGDRLRVIVASLIDEPLAITIDRLPNGSQSLRLGAYEIVTLDYERNRRL